MKQKLLLTIICAVSFLLKAQETTVNLSMGASYANQVYYKIDTEATSSYANNSWDIAFLRTSAYSIGMRVNDAAGIKVYEASNNPLDWNSINVSNVASWTQLYNDSTETSSGAFMEASASYGWGDYNSISHHVEGKIIFVLKYSDGTYRKYFCEDFYGGYTFKYATWNGSSWGDDVTVTLSNSSNTNRDYNYYSLVDNKEVIASPPSTEWDFVFTRYIEDVPTNSGTTQKYTVTGVLQNTDVSVAETSGDNTENLTYSESANTIGYNWKQYNSGWTIDNNKRYYVKYENNDIYKLYFTAWGGSGNGNVTFVTENVTSALGIEDLGETISFGVYPNPVNSERKISLVYDVKFINANTNTVQLFNLTGQKVFERTVSNNKGFYNNEIDLQGLNSGVYILKFTSGNYQKTRKIVLN